MPLSDFFGVFLHSAVGFVCVLCVFGADCGSPVMSIGVFYQSCIGRETARMTSSCPRLDPQAFTSMRSFIVYCMKYEVDVLYDS